MNILLIFLPLVLSFFILALYPLDKKWYDTLNKSPYTPHDRIFATVWPLLYILIGMGLSGPNNDWLVLNMALNLTWLIMFNGYRDVRSGFWILMSMCISLIMYIGQSNNLMILPYLVWSLFALYLNYYIFVNN